MVTKGTEGVDGDGDGGGVVGERDVKEEFVIPCRVVAAKGGSMMRVCGVLLLVHHRTRLKNNE